MSIIAASWAAVRPGPMSELGPSRHFGRRPTTSGLPLEADIVTAGRHVSKVPEADKCGIGLPEPIWADRVRRQAVPSLPQPADGLRADAQECISLRDSMPRRYLGIR